MSTLYDAIEYLNEYTGSDLEKAIADFDKDKPESVKRLRDNMMFEISQMDPGCLAAVAGFVERGRKLSELGVAARRRKGE